MTQSSKIRPVAMENNIFTSAIFLGSTQCVLFIVKIIDKAVY